MSLRTFASRKFAAIKYRLAQNGKRKCLKVRVECDKVWYGTNYGGFFANPNLLDENSIIYSFGIGEDISFDRAIVDAHNSTVYGFDPTPKSINWVKGENLPANFRFFEYGLSAQCGFVTFYLPKNPEYVSGSLHVLSSVDENRAVEVEMKSMAAIVDILHHSHIDVLKMDIEGSEYDVIEDILKLDVSIGQILIEFHSRFFDDGEAKTKSAINTLRKYGYEIFAVSESMEEVSFINKRLVG